MTAVHSANRLDAVREAAVLALAGAGVVFWAPVLAVWTALAARRNHAAPRLTVVPRSAQAGGERI